MNLSSFSKNVRRFFYLVTPEEEVYENIHDVPDFVHEVTTIFLILVVLEFFILKWKYTNKARVNDAYSSVACGSFQRAITLVLIRSELAAYEWIYKHYRIVNIPIYSQWSWWLSLIGVDFLYYWSHRASHEINVLWSFHQVHHSSEDYNLSTALRQGAFQRTWSWVLYLLLAFFLPPPIIYVHISLSLLYQFWIHTELIDSFGPLDLVLNTPSHHRVHHGRNPYCLDKNYGGTLIIWDRLFGTFQSEKKEEEEVVYGLVHPVRSWEIFYVQFFHIGQIWNKFRQMEGWKDKISSLIKGPGWVPGSPWCGNPEDVPEIEKPVVKYDRSLPSSTVCYILFQTVLFIMLYEAIMETMKDLTMPYRISMMLYLMLSMYSFGCQFEHRWYASILESVRCTLFLLIDLICTAIRHPLHLTLPGPLLNASRGIFAASAVSWAYIAFLELRSTAKPHPS